MIEISLSRSEPLFVKFTIPFALSRRGRPRVLEKRSGRMVDVRPILGVLNGNACQGCDRCCDRFLCCLSAAPAAWTRAAPAEFLDVAPAPCESPVGLSAGPRSEVEQDGSLVAQAGSLVEQAGSLEAQADSLEALTGSLEAPACSREP